MSGIINFFDDLLGFKQRREAIEAQQAKVEAAKEMVEYQIKLIRQQEEWAGPMPYGRPSYCEAELKRYEATLTKEEQKLKELTG